VTAGGRVPALERAGRVFFAYRNALVPLVLLGLLGGFTPARAFGSARADRWVDVIGILVAVLGQALRVAVIGLAYIRRGGRHRQVYAARLVTEGMFGHCRNPLYVGNVLVLLGLFIVHGHPGVVLLGLAFFGVAYRAIVAAEEAYLRERFGTEYAAYCARVPRWRLEPRGLRQSLRGMAFDWRKVIAKEYGSTAVWIGCVLLLLAWETIAFDGAAGHERGLSVLAGLLLIVASAWSVARYWKKTRPAPGDGRVSAGGAP
jgi:protein-S-isoprenylcysteine O-methyltransferase Ste14